jgi:hypothetical protein
VFDPLVDRQYQQLAGAAEPALQEDAGEVSLGARIVALVIAENPLYGVGEFHRLSFLAGGSRTLINKHPIPPLYQTGRY